MAAQTPAKTSTKTTAKLDPAVFGVTPKNHELLKAAYTMYLANGRENLAVTKTRGLVRGGGKKPWKQKGTGRARFGSSRVPIWRGGGITFGPTGQENYSKQMNAKAKQLAVRQALSLANEAGKIKVADAIDLGAKTKDAAKFLDGIKVTGKVLCVLSERDAAKELSARNIPVLKLTSASHLNVYDILNADSIVFDKASLVAISERLGGKK